MVRDQHLDPSRTTRDTTIEILRGKRRRFGRKASQRLLIHSYPFSIWQLEELINRVLGGVTFDALIGGLMQVNAPSLADPINKAITQYGIDPMMTLGEYAQQVKEAAREKVKRSRRSQPVVEDRVPLQLLLLGVIRKKDAEPSRQETRLYAYLKMVEEEQGKEIIEEGDPPGGSEEEQDWRGRQLPRVKLGYMKERRRTTWEAINDAVEAGQSWAIHAAGGTSVQHTAWVQWERLKGQIPGVHRYDPRIYLSNMQRGMVLGRMAEMSRMGDRRNPNQDPTDHRSARTEYFPNIDLVRAFAASSLRIALVDQATCDIASGMATGWKPEIVEQHKAISLLHTVVAFLTSAAAFANQLGIIHPQQGMALAILIKLKDYWGALLEAVTWYNLGTISFEAVECDPGLKDPMLPGEHPELLASTVSEIMRSMTAGLILTGQPENMRGLDLREKRENIQMPEGYGGVEGMLDMGPSTIKHRGNQDKYATVTIKRAERDEEGIIVELGQIPASPMISHRVATRGVYGSSRTSADRVMPEMGPPDGSRVSFGRHFKRVNPGFARRRMVGIVREVTDEFVQVVTKGKENQNMADLLQEREIRIGQLKYRLEATASRLYMATVGKADATEPIDLDEEVKKYYKADELKDLVAWKGKYQDLELDELESTTDGSKASELVGKLIRRIAVMAGEVERYKWATDRLKTQLIEEEKASREGRTSDAVMADASTTREDPKKGQR